MTAKLPRLTANEVLRALQRAGWQRHHQKGSHVYLRHADRPGMRVTIAIHAGEVVKPKTLRSILDQAGLTVEQFYELL